MTRITDHHHRDITPAEAVALLRQNGSQVRMFTSTAPVKFITISRKHYGGVSAVVSAISQLTAIEVERYSQLLSEAASIMALATAGDVPSPTQPGVIHNRAGLA